MGYPEYINGEAPEISLKEYDQAPWAGTTCVDRVDGKYVVVDMQNPSTVVAKVSASDKDTLDQIFQSAHADYAKQVHDNDVKTK